MAAILEILGLLGIHQGGQYGLHPIQAVMAKQTDGLEPVLRRSGLVSGGLTRTLHVGLDHGDGGGGESPQTQERSARTGQALGHADDDLLACGRSGGQHRIGGQGAQDPPQLPGAVPGTHGAREPGQPLDRLGLRQKSLLVRQPGKQLVGKFGTGTQDGIPHPEVSGIRL